MYYDHWGFTESPFKAGLDPRSYYANANHDEALARLQFLVECHRRVGLLLGPSGCGKSFLLDVFAAGLSARGARVAKVSLLGLEPEEFLLALATAWGLNPPHDAPTAQLWLDVNDRLTEHRLQRADSVVLLDDAAEASGGVLKQVARLAHYQPHGNPRLTIVLSARPRQIANLGERLVELADLRIDLRPWDLGDTEGYLSHIFALAGRQSPVFSADALTQLHERSGGVPRNINQVAELALLAAAGGRLELIDPHTVEAVCEELSASLVA